MTEAMFRTYLPDAPWRPLAGNYGYTAGFLLVMLSRMQLFTENTITTVLPSLAEPVSTKANCANPIRKPCYSIAPPDQFPNHIAKAAASYSAAPFNGVGYASTLNTGLL